MTTESESALGQQVSYMCIKAASDPALKAKLEQDPVPTLREQGLEVPAEAEERVAALVRATLYGMDKLAGADRAGG